MREQIARMSGERLSEGELTRARAYLLGLEVAGVGQGFAEAYARAVEAVTADDVPAGNRPHPCCPRLLARDPTRERQGPGSHCKPSESLLVSSASRFFPLYFSMLGGLWAPQSVTSERPA